MDRTSHDYVILKQEEGESILECEVRGLKLLTKWWEETLKDPVPLHGAKRGMPYLALASIGITRGFEINLDIVASADIDYSDWDDSTWLDTYHPVHVIELDVAACEDTKKAVAEFQTLVQALLKEKNLESQALILPTLFVEPYVSIFTSMEISEQIVKAKLPRFKEITRRVPPYMQVEDPR